jgi:hypothetical protein
MPSKVENLRIKRNRPPEGEPWCWMTAELLQSDAWRTAPVITRRFVDRVLLEHMAHAGTKNGELIVTYNDLTAWGIRQRERTRAIADAIARGLIDRTEKGRASSGRGKPAKYAIGWLGRSDGSAPRNRWKAYTSQPTPRPKSRRPPNTIDIKSSGKIHPVGNGGIPSEGWENPPRNRWENPPRNGTKSTLTEKSVPQEDNHNLPPGWQWGDFGDGHIRALCPGPPNRPWIGVPVLDGVGDALEQAARAELKAWLES